MPASQPHSITSHWLVSNYDALWKRHVCVWTTCPESLHEVEGPARSRIHNFRIATLNSWSLNRAASNIKRKTTKCRMQPEPTTPVQCCLESAEVHRRQLKCQTTLTQAPAVVGLAPALTDVQQWSTDSRHHAARHSLHFTDSNFSADILLTAVVSSWQKFCR